MKTIDESIQIVGGCLTCPHCAGDMECAGACGLGLDVIIPCFTCNDCGERVGLEFSSCVNDHTHVRWVDAPDIETMKAENGVLHKQGKDMN